jgi:hypothetical protein
MFLVCGSSGKSTATYHCSKKKRKFYANSFESSVAKRFTNEQTIFKLSNRVAYVKFMNYKMRTVAKMIKADMQVK